MMKIVFVQADGMASAPLEELGGRTPLQSAATPNLDFFGWGRRIWPVDSAWRKRGSVRYTNPFGASGI